MNKYKYGDKVYIKLSNIYGEVIGWTQRNINGEDCGYTYTIKVKLYGSFIWYIADVPENDIEKFIKVKFENGKSIQVYDDDKSAYNCDCESEQHSCTEKCDEKDYEYNKSCESLDNDKKFNLGDLYTSSQPEIVDYFYNKEKGTTVLKWSDGTTTKATVQMGDEPDRLTGFAYAVAKKYYSGNDFFAEADYWLIRKPRKEMALIKKLKQDAENERKREEKRKRNRERRVLRAKALDRKREYEARKLAAEKYGVPMEWGDDKE